MPATDDKAAEAAAFDKRMNERAAHGHIPDLRRTQACDWFYNNPWRRPYLADMILGRYFRFVRDHACGPRLLDVGSGPGHISLELARNGFDVTGLDLSPESVAGAQRIATDNPYTEDFGSLTYVEGSVMEWQPDELFDTISFVGSLHHFDDPAVVLDRVKSFLRPGGRLIAVEPARDFQGNNDAAIIALMRQLLSACGGWYEELPIPATETDWAGCVAECLREYQDGHDCSEAEQSPHDNACYGHSMLAELRDRFDEVVHEPGFAFLTRMVGGVRAASDEEERRIVEFLSLFDGCAVATGLMQPGGLLWVGERQ